MPGRAPLWSRQQQQHAFTIPIDPSIKYSPSTLPPPSQTIQCPGCDRMVYRDPYYLLLHRQLCPNGLDCLSCKGCCVLFINRKQLIQHKKTCKPSLQKESATQGQQRKSSSSGPSEYRYICRREDCGKSFLSLKTLRQHIKRHNKPYQCRVGGCSKAFGSSWDRTIHERTHREEKKEKCTFCLSTFKDPAALRRHMKRFHDGRVVLKPFQCRMCKRQFRTRDDLQIHFVSHTPRQRKESRRCSKCGMFVEEHCRKCKG